MISKGHIDTLNTLKEENRILKQNLLTLHENLKSSVD